MPEDARQQGQVTENHVHELLLRPLPAGVRLTAIMDSCLPCAVMELPYICHPEQGWLEDSERWGRELQATVRCVITLALAILPDAAKVSPESSLRRSGMHPRCPKDMPFDQPCNTRQRQAAPGISNLVLDGTLDFSSEVTFGPGLLGSRVDRICVDVAPFVSKRGVKDRSTPNLLVGIYFKSDVLF